MSRMSQLHAELSERASELGFETLQQALDNGYHINYRNKDTVELMKRQGYEEEEQEKAHKAWEAEKQEVLKDLYAMHAQAVEEDRTSDAYSLKHAIDFLQKGEV